MAYKVFLDANILLDYALRRDGYNEARSVVTYIERGEVDGFITSSVLHITGYWIAKAHGAKQAKKILLALLALVRIIDIPHEVALLALHSKIDDIEDALQYYTAIHHKLDGFISRDKQLQKDGMPVLPVITPIQFLQNFKSI